MATKVNGFAPTNLKRKQMTSEGGKVCLIGGSSFQHSELFSTLQTKTFQVNRENTTSLLTYKESSEVIFISRHHAFGEDKYDMPHEIDMCSIWQLIRELRPKVVIGLCSVGSLDPERLPVGSLCLPSDWLQANFSPINFFQNARAHVKPELDLKFRTLVHRALLAENVLQDCLGQEVVYAQTRGPRFETRAEIRMLAKFASVVGMTAGDEATIACELGLPYFMLCVVDNLAHGLATPMDGEEEAISTLANFKLAQKQNVAKLERACMIALRALSESEPGSSSSTSVPKELELIYVHQVFRARYVACVDEADRIIENGLVAVDFEGRIIGVHGEDEADGAPRYSAPTVHNLGDHILIPGLVNAHTHAAMALMRGFGDDLEMTTWLTTKIWPAETKCVSPAFVRFGTQCAVEEMLSSGTTCFLDFYFFPHEIAKVCAEAGMRCVVGMPVVAFPNAFAKNGPDHIRLALDQLKSRDQYGELITFGMAPHATYSVDEEDIIHCKRIAEEHGLIFHTHLHETKAEVEASIKLDVKSSVCHRCDSPSTPLGNLNRLGLLDSTCSFAHCCHLEEEEIALLASKRCSVMHCPASNLKLASGFCPVAKLLDAGVNVCLGTDGACSNNALDMLAEMKLAALLGKGVAADASKLNCHQVLRMATINGARALGLADKIGSIERGKFADLVAVELTNRNACRPVFDPVASLVYSATRECVTHVWVRGEMKVSHGVRVDPLLSERDMRAQCEKWEQVMRDVEAELNQV